MLLLSKKSRWGKGGVINCEDSIDGFNSEVGVDDIEEANEPILTCLSYKARVLAGAGSARKYFIKTRHGNCIQQHFTHLKFKVIPN